MDAEAGRHVDADSDDEDASCCSNTCCVKAFGLMCCMGTFICIGLAMIIYGPKEILFQIFQVIPRNPGWDWYIGLCLLTCVSIVGILPIWPPLAMGAGMIFGFWWGAASNFVAIFCAAVISICLGRFVLREPVRDCIKKGDFREIQLMMMIMEDEEESLKFQILFRFLFIPMFIRNYGPSTLNIPLWKLFVAAIPHSLWISIMFASLGATFKNTAQLIREGRDQDLTKSMRWQQLAIFVVAMTIAILLSIYAYNIYEQRMKCEDAQAILAGPYKKEVEELRRDNKDLRHEVRQLRAEAAKKSERLTLQAVQWTTMQPPALVAQPGGEANDEQLLLALVRLQGGVGSFDVLRVPTGQVLFLAVLEQHPDYGKSLALHAGDRTSAPLVAKISRASALWSGSGLEVRRGDGSVYGVLGLTSASDPTRVALAPSSGGPSVLVASLSGPTDGGANVTQVHSSDGKPLALLDREGASAQAWQLRLRLAPGADAALVVSCVLALSTLSLGN